MKICWDNLEKLKYSSRTGNFYSGTTTYYYEDACPKCQEPYLRQNRRNHHKYCSLKCAKSGENGTMYGKHHSEKTKQELSEKMKGENNSFYGKHHTYQTIQKIKEKRQNQIIYHSTETRNKMSRSKIGPNHWNWQGGITCEPYCTQWTDREYKNWLRHERDNNKCQNLQCSKSCNILHLHHINYDKKDCRPTNLITLCISCNAKANFDREWHESWYTEIIRRKGYV